MATLQDQNNKLDPGQQEYEHNFDFSRHEQELQKTNSKGPDVPAEKANIDRANAWSRDNRGVAEQEAAPEWDNNVGNSDDNSGGNGASKAGKFIQKRVNQWIIGGLVGLILTISAAVPTVLSNALVHAKELASRWGNKNNTSLFQSRTGKYMQKKFFQADKNCSGGVVCRFKNGVSDKEIQKFKDAGLNPEVAQDGNKKYIKSFSTADVDGNPVKITSDNFQEHYSTNVKFKAQMDEIAKPNSMLLRGKQTIQFVLDRLGINRNRDLSGTTEEKQTEAMRADEYSSGNATENANSAPTGNQDPATANQIQGVDDSINQAAQAERDRLTSTNFAEGPSIVSDVTNLDLSPDKAEGVASGLIKGGVKGAVLGIFSAIDKACSGYQLIRAVVFGAKIYKAIALIKYAAIFLTIADKLKAGDAKPDEIGYVAGLLFKPSSAKDSYGKTFFQSEGFNLIFQGKIGDHRGLARYTTGSSFLRFFQGAEKVFQDAGANKDTCKQVKSWYGQGSLIIAGLATDIFSGGSLSVLGVVAGAAIGMVISVLTAYVTPLLVQYAAGTVAPDPNDPEGGYGIGNAFGAGIGALGKSTGTANGGRVLTNADATTVEMESNKQMAFQDQVDNYGKNPFSLSSDSSITSQLALAAAPILASPFSQGSLQSIASIIGSPLSLFGSSFSNIVTHGVNAQNDVNRGGAYCADEDYASMDIAVDAFCNPIAGEKQVTIDDPKYDPQAVIDYMTKNGHVNDDGSPKSDDFNKYIASCVNTNVPITPDGGGPDVGENIDTRWCFDTSEEFTMFRMYIADSAIDSSYQDSVDGTLGQDGTAPTTGTPTTPGTPMSAAQCQAITDQGQKIACNAQIFEPYYYLYGGGHGSLDSLKAIINDAVSGSNKGTAVLDCSGLARAAYYMSTGADIGGGTANSQAHSRFFTPVAKNLAKPGDVIWHSSPADHIEIITANNTSAQTWSTVEASTTGQPIKASTEPYANFDSFTYTGAK